MKTAVIGLGRMGMRHLENVRALGWPLIGVADRRPEALRQVQSQFGLEEAACFTEAEALLTQKRPEVVIVATTAPAHCALTCQAAEQGARFILCEKPMAVSLAQCDLMIESCARHHARLAINHPMRFMPYFVEPKRLVQSEAFGGLASLAVLAGNFGLAMNGVHRFELLRFTTGERVKEVTAWFSPEIQPNPRGPEFEDRAGGLRAITTGGKRLVIEAHADQGHGVLSVYNGRYGQVWVDELAGTLNWRVRKPEHRNAPTSSYATPADSGHIALPPAEASGPARAALTSLVNGEDYPTGEDGRAALAALVAAFESHEHGGIPVAVDDRLPFDRIFRWA